MSAHKLQNMSQILKSQKPGNPFTGEKTTRRIKKHHKQNVKKLGLNDIKNPLL